MIRGSINWAGSACFRWRSCCWITLEGIVNYCRTRIAMGVVEAIKWLRPGSLRYPLLKAQRMAVTNTEYITSKKPA
jgi:hypothetical protein